MEIFNTNEDVGEPMHLDGDDFEREDPIASAPTIKERNTILIEDNDSNGDRQVALVDVPTG